MKRSEASFARPLTWSLLLHASLLASVLLARPRQEAMPMQVRLILTATIAGPRAEGVIDRTPPETETRSSESEAPAIIEKKPEVVKPPTKPPERKPEPVKPTTASAARNTSPKPSPAENKTEDKPKSTDAPPRAGGGPVGGSGSDVANVEFEGIDFPYTTWLKQLNNKILARFPDQQSSTNWVAQVAFNVDRKGCASNIRITKPSASRAFNLEARGAVEAALKDCPLPLPDGFADDVLPIYYTFKPPAS